MTGLFPFRHKRLFAKCAVFPALLASLLLTVVPPKAAVAGDSAALAVKMIASQNYSADGAINVSFSLHNTSGKDLHLLLWGTPFEGVVTREFVHVQFNGNRLLYRGPVVKRAAPGIDDFQRLRAGESINATWDLKQLFKLESPGEYVVLLPALTIQYRENGLEQMLSIHTDSEIGFTIR